MKESDPFMDLIEIMRSEGSYKNPIPYLTGTVISVSPLTISVGELKITREHIKINQSLVQGTVLRMSMQETAVTGETEEKSNTGNSYEAFSSHTHNLKTLGITDGEFKVLDDFKLGEEVLMVPSSNGQQFIILCRLK